PSPAVACKSRIAHRSGSAAAADRIVPEEMPVALSYGGTTHAVMMASPADFEDFALGFSITEGIISAASEIDPIEVLHLEQGVDIQIRLKDIANRRFEARRRRLAGPVGCGLCGIESIEESMRSVQPVTRPGFSLSARDVVDAVRVLSASQPMHAQ